MRLNTAAAIQKSYTHEGALAKNITPEQALRRSVLSCLLWEKQFYEDGASIVDRISENAAKCDKETVAALAVEARNAYGLRHAPLMLLLDIIRRGGTGVSDTIAATIRRPDEMGELLALYWRDGRKPLSKQLQRGLAKAFGKFSEYQLAKYDRDGPVKLRDVAFLAHVKPKDRDHAKLMARLVNRTFAPQWIIAPSNRAKVTAGDEAFPVGLAAPDTWEVQLSGGADKRGTFERLIQEGKLGYLALLRNLRNMVNAGCDLELVKDAIVARGGAELVFPFRYVAAARACPQLELVIDQALCEAVASGPRLSGKTVVLVDVSGSMNFRLSSRSDMTRMDAAAALASVINGDVRVFTFSQQVVEVPPRRGMAGVDAVIRSQPHGGTYLGRAVAALNQQVPHDRLIVVTDEQSHDRVPDPVAKCAYMINVASYRNGVGYGRWKHIDGFSEGVIRWIHEVESDGI